MTLLIASMPVRNPSRIESEVRAARRAGADAVELRVDEYQDAPRTLNRIIGDHTDLVWIVTCRSIGEGGASAASPEDRAALVAEIVRGTQAFVDFEFADWERSSTARDVIVNAVARVDGRQRVILSAHAFDAPFPNAEERVNRMLADPHARVVKLAYRARNAAESLTALDVMHRHGDRVCVMAMGSCGVWTRLLARKLGAWGVYAALDENRTTAPGQLTVEQIVHRFRWRNIASTTRVFGVVGDPVAHSMSPILFNDWFEAHGIDGVYVPLHAPGDAVQLASFLDGVCARSWLDLCGLSITVPHKSHALSWCGAGADAMANAIGAANTLVFDDGGVRAFNTDCYAAVDSLCDALNGDRTRLAGIRVDLLGAGGAARAILYGLHEYGCRGTIYARTPARGEALARAFGFAYAPWSERLQRAGDVVINATPIGMWPRVDVSPLPPEALAGCRLVFDTIYNPLETALLKEARRQGIATRNGLDMFIRQAAMQFALWIGRPPDTRRAVELLTKLLGDQATPEAPSQERVGDAVVLIGLRGAGKTTVGRILADRLGVDYVDADRRIIEEAGVSITDIFRREGEAGFRRRERTIIEQITSDPPGVIGVGGGAVLDADNLARLRAVGSIVWLTAPPEVLWERVSADPSSFLTRPPLTDLGGLEELQALARERAPVYQQTADLIVDTTDKSPESVADEIIRALSVKRGGPPP